MVGNISLAQYNRIARINQNLNRFIREATITKMQMSASLNSSSKADLGIGAKVDVFA